MSIRKANRLSLGLLSLGLTLAFGCGGSPEPTPTPTPTVKPSITPTSTPTPVAEYTPDPAATAFITPTPKTAEELEYDKFKAQAESLTLGKGYQEAIPLLRECLKKRPDDVQVDFYLMLCIGNTEDEPSTESEAYKFAKIVLEKAPGSPLADRASDYIISAESEPAKPLPDLEGEALSDILNPAKPDNHTAYTLAVPITMFVTRSDAATPDVKKKMWYLEVKPDAVATEEKMVVPKGTSVSVQNSQQYYFSKNSWRGGGTRSEAEASANFDKNTFSLMGFRITLESGPNKGARGWYANQVDRFKGVDEDGKQVWGVKVLPRLVIPRSKGR